MDVLPETLLSQNDKGISYVAVTLEYGLLRWKAWIWDLKQWKPLWELPYPKPGLLYPNAQFCVYGSGPELSVVAPPSGVEHKWLCSYEDAPLGIQKLFYVSENRFLVTFSNDDVHGIVAQLYTTDGKCLKTVKYRYRAGTVKAFSPVSMCLLAATGAWVTWFDVNSGEELKTLSYREIGSCINAATFSYDGKLLLMSGEGNVMVWRFPEMTPSNILPLGNCFNALSDRCAISPDNKHLVLISRPYCDGRVLVYSLPKGTILGEIAIDSRDAKGFFLDANNFCVWFDKDTRLFFYRITIYDTAPPTKNLLGVIDLNVLSSVFTKRR